MKHGKRPYTSAFFSWKKESALFFSSCLTPFHSHNSLQLVLDTQKSFKLRTTGKPWAEYRSLLIREDIIHQLDTNNSVQLIIYLDPESTEGQSINKCWLGDQEMKSLDRDIFHLMNSFELQQALLSQHPSILENLIG